MEKERNGMKIRRWIWFGLWASSLVAISFYGGTISYGFFFGVTLLPLISLVYLLCVYARFKIYQEAGKQSMVTGQPMPYFFVLQNEDFFAYTGISVRMHSHFSCVEGLSQDIEYEVLPGDKSVFETKLVCKYRGEYEIGVKEVVVTDFFRLFRLRHPVYGEIKAVVQPKVVQLSELISIVDLPTLTQKESRGSMEPDLLVRDYVEGDSLKQIHWKATAREQKLKVRVMIGKENQDIAIFCDTRRYSDKMRDFLPLENKILEAFLAVGFFFAVKEREFTAYYGQGGIVKHQVQGINDFDTFYHQVSQIAFGKEESPQDVFGQVMERGNLWENKVVFCVFHELDDVIMDGVERLTAEGVIVVIYVITDQPSEGYVRLGSLRKRIIVIPVEADLEGRL